MPTIATSNHPAYGKGIDYHTDLQPILHAYLLAKASPAVPTVAYSFITATVNVAENQPLINRQLRESVAKIKALHQKTPDNPRRLVVGLPLAGHFGFAVVDLKSNELVIGEPFGHGHDEELKQYIATFKAVFPNVKVIQSEALLQEDNFSCGRIVAKTMTYLATTQQSLSEAMQNQAELDTLKPGRYDTASSKAYYEEQQQLLQDSPLSASNTLTLKKKYTNLLTVMGINTESLPIDHDVLYHIFQKGFTAATYFPCLLVDPAVAYGFASDETRANFKDIVTAYIALLQLNDSDLQKPVAFKQFVDAVKKHVFVTDQLNELMTIDKASEIFAYACNGMIPQLTANYSKDHLQKLDEAAERSKNTRDESLTQSAPPVPEAALKGLDKAWQTIKTSEFIKLYEDKGHAVESKSNDEVKITVGGKTVGFPDADKKTVTIRKNPDNHIETRASNPNEKALELMADTLGKALGPKGKVSLQVTGASPLSDEVQKIKDKLWLEAMKAGLEVVDYQPTDATILQKGQEAQQAALSESQSRSGFTR